MVKKIFRIYLLRNSRYPLNLGTKLLMLLFVILSQFNVVGQVSSNLDSLLAVSKTQANSPEQVKTSFLIGYNYRKSSPEKAAYYYHYSQNLGNKLKQYKYVASTYAQLALLHNTLGNADSTEHYLEKTKSLVEKYPEETDPSSYYQAAGLIYKYRNDYEKAIELTKKNIEYLESSNADKITIAGAYHNLSSIYWLLKKLTTAIEYEYKALELFSAGGSETGVAYANTSLGNIYHDLGQERESIKHHTLSLEFKKKTNDMRGMANSYLNISTAYLGLMNYNKALEYVNKSIAINKELNIQPEQVKYLFQTAIIYQEKKDTLTALNFYEQALTLGEKIKNTSLISEIEKRRNEFLPNPQKNKTIPGLLANLKEYKEKEDSLQISNSLKELTSQYYAKQNYKEAFAYQQKYYEMEKSMFGPEVLNRMKQLENKYNLSQKENTIVLLKKEKEINGIKLERQRTAIFTAIGIIVLILLIAYLLFNRHRILQENRRILEVEKVRTEIARDLHDDVGSTMM